MLDYATRSAEQTGIDTPGFASRPLELLLDYLRSLQAHGAKDA